MADSSITLERSRSSRFNCAKPRGVPIIGHVFVFVFVLVLIFAFVFLFVFVIAQ